VKGEPRNSILLVEDEGIVAMDLQQALIDMGYDAYAIATSAEEAVEKCEERTPELVLMDIRIRGRLDGIDIASILRQRFHVPVVYLTAYSDERLIERAKQTEPYGYLLKPIKLDDLRSVIELTLHKRALESSRALVRTSERRLVTITDNIPIMIIYIDRNDRVQFANRLIRELVGYTDDHLDVHAKEFLGTALYEESAAPRGRALLGEQVSFVLEFERNGRRRRREVTYLPDFDASGAIVGVYGLGYDVTEREQTLAELGQARADLHAIVDNIPARITSWRNDATNRFANKVAESTFGLSAGQAEGKHAQDIIGIERYQRAEPYIATVLTGKHCSREAVDRQKDGSLRYSHVEYVPQLTGGVVTGYYVLATDVTALRESNERIRALAQRLEAVREEERRSVSTTLQEGVAQELFAMQLGFKHLEALVEGHMAAAEMCHELHSAAAKCLDEVRTVASNLHPEGLAHLRISVLLGDYARRFALHTALRVQVTEVAPFPELDASVGLLFYRAAQELLNNVLRHAQATAVDIVLRTDVDRIVMDVIDDGRGLTEAALHRSESLGLLGIRERFAALGGGITVAERAPSGARLTVYLPHTAALVQSGKDITPPA
jgi:PAS domain S-box-containing protein